MSTGSATPRLMRQFSELGMSRSPSPLGLPGAPDNLAMVRDTKKRPAEQLFEMKSTEEQTDGGDVEEGVCSNTTPTPKKGKVC